MKLKMMILVLLMVVCVAGCSKNKTAKPIVKKQYVYVYNAKNQPTICYYVESVEVVADDKYSTNSFLMEGVILKLSIPSDYTIKVVRDMLSEYMQPCVEGNVIAITFASKLK